MINVFMVAINAGDDFAFLILLCIISAPSCQLPNWMCVIRM